MKYKKFNFIFHF